MDEFQELTEPTKARIQQKFFLERCAIKLLIRKQSPIRKNASISVLDIAPVNADEFVENAKIY